LELPQLRVTYHHNWFNNCHSRLPSLRFGTAHIYNNVYENGETSGINSRMGAQVLVESNVFTNTRRPIITNLDSDEDGFAVELNNIFNDDLPEITQEGTFTNPPYSYNAEDVNGIESIVKAQAGNTVSFP
jgi:pectate lyase